MALHKSCVGPVLLHTHPQATSVLRSYATANRQISLQKQRLLSVFSLTVLGLIVLMSHATKVVTGSDPREPLVKPAPGPPQFASGVGSATCCGVVCWGTGSISARDTSRHSAADQETFQPLDHHGQSIPASPRRLCYSKAALCPV